jgi:hypothetical protein
MLDPKVKKKNLAIWLLNFYSTSHVTLLFLGGYIKILLTTRPEHPRGLRRLEFALLRLFVLVDAPLTVLFHSFSHHQHFKMNDQVFSPMQGPR